MVSIQTQLLTLSSELSYKSGPHAMDDVTDPPTPQMVFWKLGDWRCEYWRTSSQRRLIVFFKDEPLINQPCGDAESVVLRSRDFKRLVQAAQRRTELN